MGPMIMKMNATYLEIKDGNPDKTLKVGVLSVFTLVIFKVLKPS